MIISKLNETYTDNKEIEIETETKTKKLLYKKQCGTFHTRNKMKKQLLNAYANSNGHVTSHKKK